jgi:hypothetical protein
MKFDCINVFTYSQKQILKIQTNIPLLLNFHLRTAVARWHNHIDLPPTSIKPNQPILLVILLLFMQILIFCEVLVHLVEG